MSHVKKLKVKDNTTFLCEFDIRKIIKNFKALPYFASACWILKYLIKKAEFMALICSFFLYLSWRYYRKKIYFNIQLWYVIKRKFMDPILLRKDFVKTNYTAWKYHKETIIMFQIITSSIKITTCFPHPNFNM